MHRYFGVGMGLVLPALLSVGGCDWLGLGSSTPSSSEKARPGAERQVTVTTSLPGARGAGYDGAVAPVDETRSAPIGSMVAAKGGQKAQIEAANKEAAERDAKAREERERQQREAALRKAQEEPDKAGKKPATPGEAAPPAPAADATPPAAAPPLPPDPKQ
jgi:hypothetical protein